MTPLMRLKALVSDPGTLTSDFWSGHIDDLAKLLKVADCTKAFLLFAKERGIESPPMDKALSELEKQDG